MPLIVCALIAAVFAPVVGYEFVWDDGNLIAHNPWLDWWSTGWRALSSDFWMLSRVPHQSGMYRPLVIQSYWAEVLLAGRNPAHFHLVNLGLHLANASLLWALSRRLGAGTVPAALAMAAFGLHPATVDAVANVCSRTDLLALTGILAGSTLWLSPGRLRWWAPLPLLLGMLSKETALVGPALAIALGAFCRPEERWPRLLYPALSWLPALWLRQLAIAGSLPREAFDWRVPGTRSLAYLGRLVWPSLVSPLRPAPVPSAWAAISGLAALALALVPSSTPRAPRALRAGGLLLVLGLLPVLEIVPVGARFSDLLIYIPLAGAALVLAATPPRIAVVLGATILPIFALSTARHLPIWSTNLRLWSHMVEHGPGDPTAQLNYANAIKASGDRARACGMLPGIVALAHTAADTDIQVRALFNLGNCHRESAAHDEALAAYGRALELSRSAFLPARINQVASLQALGRLEEAVERATVLTVEHPQRGDFWQLLGATLASRGLYRDALQAFEHALEIDPDDSESLRMAALAAELLEQQTPE